MLSIWVSKIKCALYQEQLHEMTKGEAKYRFVYRHDIYIFMQAYKNQRHSVLI